jgi:hypothetical protein
MAGQDAGGRGGIEDVLLRFDCFQERRQRMAGDDAVRRWASVEDGLLDSLRNKSIGSVRRCAKMREEG